MLGTSARIGEVLAIRRRDSDIAGAVPSIRIAGTIVTPGRADRAAGPPENQVGLTKVGSRGAADLQETLTQFVSQVWKEN